MGEAMGSNKNPLGNCKFRNGLARREFILYLTTYGTDREASIGAYNVERYVC